MRLRSLRHLTVRGKRVLLRAGFNVPTDARGRVADDWRIQRGLPTIRALLKQRSRIVIVTHRGRPKGKTIPKLSLRGLALYLEQTLRRRVAFVPEVVGPNVSGVVAKLKPGQIALLENVRFHPGEEVNARGLARQLSALADCYIDDAFENAHRKHASMVAVTQYLPSAAGLLLEEEVRTLERALVRPRRPLVTIIGGAKISTKIGLIRTLLPQVDYLLLGGALANAVLKAKGIQIGRSVIEPHLTRVVQGISMEGTKIKIPIDVVVATTVKPNSKTRRRAVGAVRSREVILDLGPDTAEFYRNILACAGTIIWNGPMGLCEVPPFAKGTRAVAHAVACSAADTIIGGGETIEAVRRTGLLDQFTFVSTGGGAMLEFLEKRTLPALNVLQQR